MTSTPFKNVAALVCLTVLWASTSLVSRANMEPIPPFMGDWEGGWVDAPKKDGNAKNIHLKTDVIKIPKNKIKKKERKLFQDFFSF